VGALYKNVYRPVKVAEEVLRDKLRAWGEAVNLSALRCNTDESLRLHCSLYEGTKKSGDLTRRKQPQPSPNGPEFKFRRSCH